MFRWRRQWRRVAGPTRLLLCGYGESPFTSGPVVSGATNLNDPHLTPAFYSRPFREVGVRRADRRGGKEVKTAPEGEGKSGKGEPK